MLGNDFPGVVAATLCAKRGLRVLLATIDKPPESYRVGPHRLPVRPMGVIGLDSPAVRRVVDELNFTHLLRRRIACTTPAFQFVTDNARLDVRADDDGFAAELARELPTVADQLRARCANAAEVTRLFAPVLGRDAAFPPTGFWERRETSRHDQETIAAANLFDEAIGDAPGARALLDVPAALTTDSAPTELGAIARARAFHLWRTSAGRLPGGYQELTDIFLEKFASHGGEVRAVSPEGLSVHWGKATGVRLQEDEEIGADHIIAAMPLHKLRALTGNKPPKRIAQLDEQLRPAGYRYTLNLVIAEAGIPEGMAHTCLTVADPNAPLYGANALGIYLADPDDEARIRVTVEAICEAPGEGESLADKLAALRGQIRDRLDEVMPFSREHILVAHSPNEAQEPEGVEPITVLDQPIPARPVWSSSLEAALGVSAAPYVTGTKRLTLASTQVLPGLGIEGDFAVGWSAAKPISSTAKSRDYLGDEVIGTR